MFNIQQFLSFFLKIEHALGLLICLFQIFRFLGRSVVGERWSGRRLFRNIVIITLVLRDGACYAYVAGIVDSYSYLQIVCFDHFVIDRVNKDPVLCIRLSCVPVDDRGACISEFGTVGRDVVTSFSNLLWQ